MNAASMHTTADKTTVDALIASLLATSDATLVPVLQDAIEAGVSGAGKDVYVIITEKARRHFGRDIAEKRAEHDFAIVTPGKQIRIFGLKRCHDLGCIECVRRMNAWYELTGFVPGKGYTKPGMTHETAPSVDHHLVAYDRAFSVGDTGSRSSFNLDYLATIVAISAKSVAFEDTSRNRKADGSYPRAVHDLAKFSRRHRDFDLEASIKRNADWRD